MTGRAIGQSGNQAMEPALSLSRSAIRFSASLSQWGEGIPLCLLLIWIGLERSGAMMKLLSQEQAHAHTCAHLAEAAA
jgi:hypothetical protein